jgi:hypothetical protein
MSNEVHKQAARTYFKALGSGYHIRSHLPEAISEIRR